MKNNNAKALTAAQEILLGAASLDAAGMTTFTEWDLTVTTWRRNPNRFGCRGYEPEYPDHKRVMMEIMGTTKKENPIRRGWLVKTRQNTYALTDLGRSEAERLSRSQKPGTPSPRSPQPIYDAVAPLYKSAVFRRHSKDKDEPRMWVGAASFLQLTSSDPQHVRDRIAATRSAIDNALEWMDENDTATIRRGVTGSGQVISRNNLIQLRDFFTIITNRFAAQIDAILQRSR